jgi:hypothetical protein
MEYFVRLKVFTHIISQVIWDKRWQMLILLTLTGCNLAADGETPTSAPDLVTHQVETATPAPTPLPITEVSGFFAEWCFAALQAAAGQRMVITDETGMNALYAFVDTHCEVSPPRPTIDFSSQALIVVVDAVRACRAEYVPTSLENGRLVLQFVQEGACPYDLVVFYAGTLTRSAGEIQVMVSGA